MTTDFKDEMFSLFGWEDFNEDDCIKTAINGGMLPDVAVSLPMDGKHSEIWAKYITDGLAKDGIEFEE